MRAKLPPKLSVNEKKALEREINRQIAENIHKMSLDLQALVLWSLREQYGFGRKRLLAFQKAFLPRIKELQEYYEMKTADDVNFVCRHKLRSEVGIDVAELGAMFEFEIGEREGKSNHGNN